LCRAKATVISQSDKFDKLKKLKELLNDGTLTQEEYDAEKEVAQRIKITVIYIPFFV
jgi:hypothetical protein